MKTNRLLSTLIEIRLALGGNGDPASLTAIKDLDCLIEDLNAERSKQAQRLAVNAKKAREADQGVFK